MSKEYVGIVSDSHGRFAALEKMIEQGTAGNGLDSLR